MFFKSASASKAAHLQMKKSTTGDESHALYFHGDSDTKMRETDRKRNTSTDAKHTMGKNPVQQKPRRSKQRTKKSSLRKVTYLDRLSKVHQMVRRMDSERGSFDDLPDLKRYQGIRVSHQMHQLTADTSIASSFVDLNTIYTFRLGGHSTISQTSGVVNTFIACDPSATGVNFPEWATLSSLFSEFRLKLFQVQFVIAPFNTTALGTAVSVPPIMICGNLGTAVAPGSYAAIADNADAKLWAAAKDTSKNGYTHRLSGTHLNFSQVTTPTTEPYAGAPGSIQVYGSFGSTSQADVIHVLISGVYEFRSRV